MQKTMKEMQSKMEEQIRQQQRSRRYEGEVTVEQNRNKQNNRQNEGEYVDFEEVDWLFRHILHGVTPAYPQESTGY